MRRNLRDTITAPKHCKTQGLLARLISVWSLLLFGVPTADSATVDSHRKTSSYRDATQTSQKLRMSSDMAALLLQQLYGKRAALINKLNPEDADVLVSGPAESLTQPWTTTQLGALGLGTYAAYSILAR